MAKTFDATALTPKFDDFLTKSSEMVEQNVERSVEFLNSLAATEQPMMKAVAESAKATTQGFGEMNKRATSYALESYESGTSAFESLKGVKSVEEAIELQTGYVRSAFERYVEELTAFAGLAASTMKEASKPMNERAGSMFSMWQAKA